MLFRFRCRSLPPLSPKSAAGVARQTLIKSWLAERLDLEDRLDALAHLGMPRPAPRPAPKEQAAEGQGPADQAES